jgi:glycosyltransferase involved in cell wall biosynthesis
MTYITVGNIMFVILSFEGPDRYSFAGGLAVRVTNLCNTLSDNGFLTHLFFIGDPREPGKETIHGKLTLHRCCQSVSEQYPNDVYEGENQKILDFNQSVPSYLIDRLVKPAIQEDGIVFILGEEWHTAEAMCIISDQLRNAGLRDKVIMFWNANNTFGFDRIDWGHLRDSSTITTVSRYMRHIMWGIGLNPLVIPNGIPESLLTKVDSDAAARARTSVGSDVMLTKIARWDQDKGWYPAVEAVARLKADGLKTVLLARGGIEPYGADVMHHARSLGLKVEEVSTNGDATFEDRLRAIADACEADIINVMFHCPQDFLRIIYRASDAVLANSGHEPFGLVGLETMAAEGIVFTGGTGEDYAIPFQNCVVLETSDSKEIEAYVIYLLAHPEEGKRIRRLARHTATLFTWGSVVKTLLRKLEYQANVQGNMALISPGSRAVNRTAGVATKNISVLGYRQGQPNDRVWMLLDIANKQGRLLGKQEAERLLSNVPDQYEFFCQDGVILRNMKDLAEAMTRMTDATFTYHSNAEKKDFSNWVKDIIGDFELARELEKVWDRSKAAQIVSQRVAVLSKRLT